MVLRKRTSSKPYYPPPSPSVLYCLFSQTPHPPFREDVLFECSLSLNFENKITIRESPKSKKGIKNFFFYKNDNNNEKNYYFY